MQYSDQQIEDMANMLLQNDEQYMSDSPTNRQHINNVLRDPKFRIKISNILKQKNKQFPHQYLTIELQTLDECDVELDSDDIQQVCANFGEVKQVFTKNNGAIIKFGSIFDAYVVYKILNRHHIKELDVIIKIEFTSPQDLEITDISDIQQKYTCRYDVQIDNDKEFQVARKIIGSKGCNMKKIIDQCLVDSSREFDLIKLRLRGKGSGYKEGPEKRESQEPLHLCVSSKHANLFSKACSQVELLLELLLKQGKKDQIDSDQEVMLIDEIRQILYEEQFYVRITQFQ
ncbi:hypothetical protein pb186bvf_012461 [Paramecium bursaria]